MAEETKIYAMENANSNNFASMAALLNSLSNARNNPLEMAALLNNNGIGGNNAIWILFMMLLWGQNGNFGGWGNNK